VKNFSNSTAAAAASDAKVWARAAAVAARDPYALFSDFQWFMFKAQGTVWFAAFTSVSFTREHLQDVVAHMVGLAPQLTYGFVGSRPGQPIPKAMLEDIVSLGEVDTFDGLPDGWMGTNADLFERDDLPLFRVRVANLKGGPDAQGRAALVMVRGSHAVLEGSDSALLTRSLSAAHGMLADHSNKIETKTKLSGTLQGVFSASLYLLFGYLLAKPEMPYGFKTLAIKRQRLRAVANKLGIGQRSLLFALVVYAINGSGEKKALNSKAVRAAYTLLTDDRTEVEDDFMRLHAKLTKFKVSDGFVGFARSVHNELMTCDAKDNKKFQVAVKATFGAIRGLNRLIPFIPSRRFWRFNGGIDIGLTLIPPHRTYGELTANVMEPIYCGAWQPNTNACTYVPAREYVTLTFSMEDRHIASVDRVMALLEEAEAAKL
jgi:hypothetical protein